MFLNPRSEGRAPSSIISVTIECEACGDASRIRGVQFCDSPNMQICNVVGSSCTSYEADVRSYTLIVYILFELSRSKEVEIRIADKIRMCFYF